MTTTTPMVFSSQSLTASSGERWSARPPSAPAAVPRPSSGELLPAHLDVDAGDEVGLSDGLPSARRRCCQRRLRARPPSIAASLEPVVEQPAACFGSGAMPEVADHVDAAHLHEGRLRILVLVDHVLVERLRHELLGIGVHARGHERRQVEARVAVQHELVVDDLVGDLGGHLVRPGSSRLGTRPISRVNTASTGTSRRCGPGPLG